MRGEDGGGVQGRRGVYRFPPTCVGKTAVQPGLRYKLTVPPHMRGEDTRVLYPAPPPNTISGTQLKDLRQVQQSLALALAAFASLGRAAHKRKPLHVHQLARPRAVASVPEALGASVRPHLEHPAMARLRHSHGPKLIPNSGARAPQKHAALRLDQPT